MYDTICLIENIYEYMLGFSPNFNTKTQLLIQPNVLIVYPEMVNILMNIYPKLSVDFKQKILNDILMIFTYEKANIVRVQTKSDLLCKLILIGFGLSFKQQDEKIEEMEKGILDLSMKIIDKILLEMFFTSKKSEYCSVIQLLVTESEKFILLKRTASQAQTMAEYKHRQRFRVDRVRSQIFNRLLTNINQNAIDREFDRESFNVLMVDMIKYVFTNLTVDMDKSVGESARPTQAQAETKSTESLVKTAVSEQSVSGKTPEVSRENS